MGAVSLLASSSWAQPRQPKQSERFAAALLSNALNAEDFPEALAVSFVTAPNAHTQIDPAQDPNPEELKRRGVAVQLRVDVGPPPASLLVWVVNPASGSGPPKGTILCLHGVCGSRRHGLGLARQMAKRGYYGVTVDMRGHGRSTGTWMTYGVLDSRDLVQVLDALLAKALVREPIGVYGISYGAATAHQLAAIDPRVKAVVSCSAFSSLREVVPVYAWKYLPMITVTLTPEELRGIVGRAGELGGFDPDDASPVKAIQRHTAATLLVHGTHDTHIPFSHAQALHAAAPGHSTLHPVQGGTHRHATGKAARREAVAWFGKHLGATE